MKDCPTARLKHVMSQITVSVEQKLQSMTLHHLFPGNVDYDHATELVTAENLQPVLQLRVGQLGVVR